MSDRRLSKRIDTRIGKINADLDEFYRSVVTKRELSNITKLSVFKLVFVLILTSGHESWVMTVKNIIFKCKGRNGIFVKSPWCDTSQQSAQL